MKKLFAFDLDGTLLTSEGKIHPETINALKLAKKHGHYLAIATGRAIASTTIFLKQFPDFDFLISNNGTAIYDVKNKETFIKDHLPSDLLDLFLNAAKESKSFFTLSTEKNVYPFKEKNQDFTWLSQQEKMDYDEQLFKSEEELKEAIFIRKEKITQLALRNSQETIKKLAEKYTKILNQSASCIVTNRVYLDINPKNTDKFFGLELILKKLNLTTNNLITFGDSGNDILMIKNAAKGFAMENGTDSAKEVAFKIIGNHNSDSISKTIKELI
ncbi:Cof-type HAD-IIB family hydrolase [Mesomycoplasma molare]|uniref:Cof-type HAD-IIB family hydrolase n=1 Tax=Mesomycoplasma molare TaxID=171288 RepID=A0ABY5TUX8_9BACT|nr:Cof-type HAD-IIB family hydrolase [Mesomycoplasma molare]UWD34457.1 Cof-type HAD-IIB family hydrolase [Mesomycoplasma molare]